MFDNDGVFFLKKERKTHVFFEVKKLMNLTTEINLLNKQTDPVVEAIEYSADHVVFEVDEKSCSKGQLVDVEATIHFESEKIPFKGTGKISEATKIGNSRMKVSIHLHDFDKDLWKKFISTMQKRQKELEQLFKSMKDDE